MNRGEKSAEVKVIGDGIAKAKMTMCVEYRGLTVAQISTLRRALRSSGSLGRVSKNTLMRVAVKERMRDINPAELEKFVNLLEGPNMLVLSEGDPVTSAKAITKFAKENEKLKIKGAIVDGVFVDGQGVDTLSKLPSREETLAKLLSLINAPATQLLRLMATPATQLTRVLDAHRANVEKKAA